MLCVKDRIPNKFVSFAETFRITAWRSLDWKNPEELALTCAAVCGQALAKVASLIRWERETTCSHSWLVAYIGWLSGLLRRVLGSIASACLSLFLGG